MWKVFKWFGFGIGGLVILVLISAAIISISANTRLNKTYQISPVALAIPMDEESIQEGKRLASIYCTGCHGPDLGGSVFFNDPSLAVVDAPNLTPGSGGIGSIYTDLDWIRSIRHGVDTEGKPLFIMPSKDFYYLSDEDLGQIVAYLKTLPPVEQEYNNQIFSFMGRILIGAGAFGDVLNAESIDHTGPRPVLPVEGVTSAYGEYLVTTFGCQTCHGEQLSGGKDPDPNAPLGPNLTPDGNMADWTEADFINTIRTRKSEWMPFESLAKMSDDELKAVWAYLHSLPALETTSN